MSTLRLLAVWLVLGTGILVGVLASPGWGGEEMHLSKADQQLLLQTARDAITAHLKEQAPPQVQTTSPVLCESRGAFVSLHRRGNLRGCIGYLEAVKPLLQTVREMAAAAAFHDPRFTPLRLDELDDLEIEISVLTPMHLIKNVDEIEVGKHGLYIVRGSCRGLLLPQVATQYHWDKPTFLAQTCCKAGLPPEAWKDPATKIYTFTAEIFADHPTTP